MSKLAKASVAMIATTGLLLAACGGDDGGGRDGGASGAPVPLRVDQIGYGSTLPENNPIKQILDEETNIDLTINAVTDGGGVLQPTFHGTGRWRRA